MKSRTIITVSYRERSFKFLVLLKDLDWSKILFVQHVKFEGNAWVEKKVSLALTLDMAIYKDMIRRGFFYFTYFFVSHLSCTT